MRRSASAWTRSTASLATVYAHRHLSLIDIVRGSRWLAVVFLRAGYPEVLDACGRVLDGATCLLPEESLCRTPVA